MLGASVAGAVINQLVGHKGQGTDEVEYLHDLPMEQLFEGVSKVQWSEVEATIEGKSNNFLLQRDIIF